MMKLGTTVVLLGAQVVFLWTNKQDMGAQSWLYQGQNGVTRDESRVIRDECRAIRNEDACYRCSKVVLVCPE